MRQRRWTRAAVAVSAVILLTGCGDNVVEPTQFTSISDKADYSATTSEVDDVLRRAVASALAASGGRRLDGADRATDTTCDPLYGKSFRQLESGGTFLIDSGVVDQGVEQIRAAWADQGWEVEVTSPDRVRLIGSTSTGVTFNLSAELRAVDNNPELVGVSLKLLSDCLKLPDEVVAP